MITVRTPTGDKAAAAFTLRTPTGDKAVSQMTLRTPTGDEVIYSAAGVAGLTVDISPLSAIGSGGSFADIDVTTNTVTVTPTGGVAPYTYSWADVSPSVDWTILSPAAAATRFRGNDVPEGSSFMATFVCTVTDSRGATGSAEVQAEVFNFGGF